MTDSGSGEPDGAAASSSGGTNWTAVAAVAGALATAVAVLAYVLPPSPGPAPAPVPAPVVASGWSPPPSPVPPSPTPSPYPAPEPSPTPSPTPPPPPKPTPSPVHSLPVPALSLPPVRPGGCDQAYAVLNRYNKVVGTTKGSRIAAAQEARDGMMGASLDASGGVYSIMVRLTQGFQEMGFILMGAVGGDYNAVAAGVGEDVETLKSLCETG
ncbi:hypothetical protein ACIRPK_18400 [Kitasatospora sp. NPDC101801]|uniref:hypothetical protein n=1 Tax=Kitasatospora sp. NPDC101801 TaxID=3364103 RepID=UPI0037F6AF40